MVKDKKEINKISSTQITNEQFVEFFSNNLKALQDIHHSIEKIRKYIFWNRVWWVVKLFIIMIPFALAFIYLPPLLREYFENIQQYIKVILPTQFK